MVRQCLVPAVNIHSSHERTSILRLDVDFKADVPIPSGFCLTPFLDRRFEGLQLQQRLLRASRLVKELSLNHGGGWPIPPSFGGVGLFVTVARDKARIISSRGNPKLARKQGEPFDKIKANLGHSCL